MADIAEWVAAAEPALPWEEGTFMKSYKKAREEALIDLFGTDPFAQAVFNVVNATANKTKTDTATNWLKLLRENAKLFSGQEPQGWPKSNRRFASALRRVSPQLRTMSCTWKADNSATGTNYTIWIGTNQVLPTQ